uniref:(northern house mosquito) hypothetical protein n=1 Tax=Culex pipiens TaxID=7175 RepID=A0A8D7ZTR4_CULPI
MLIVPCLSSLSTYGAVLYAAFEASQYPSSSNFLASAGMTHLLFLIFRTITSCSRNTNHRCNCSSGNSVSQPSFSSQSFCIISFAFVTTGPKKPSGQRAFQFPRARSSLWADFP